MKKKGIFLMACVVVSWTIFPVVAVATEPGIRNVTGEVTGVGPDGKGVAVKTMMGDKEMIAGAIVTDETIVMVHSKKAGIKDIKTGDKVTLIYAYENDNLYAKKIAKP